MCHDVFRCLIVPGKKVRGEGAQQMKWKVRGVPKQGDLDNFKGGWEEVSGRMNRNGEMWFSQV